MIRRVRALALMLFCLPILAAEVAKPVSRDQMFFELVKERHTPPVDKARWAEHVSRDAIWVGRGLRVARREEVAAMQIGGADSVEIKEFEVHDYGHVAVLTYLVIEHRSQGNAETTTRLRKLDTYVEHRGKWQLAANAEIVGKRDREAVSLDPKLLDRLTGTYETLFKGAAVRTRIWRDGTRLWAQTEGQEKTELLPLSPTVFFEATDSREGGPEDEFVLGADGRATQWIYRDGGVEFPARRVSD